MNFYEGLFLLDPADATGNWTDLKGYITGLLERFGCEILYSERWSDKKLAYPIKGRQKGTYFLVYFKAAGDTLTALKDEIRIAERILRVLFLRKDKALEEIEKLKEHKMKQASASADDDEGYALSDDSGDDADDGRGRTGPAPRRAAPVAQDTGSTDKTEDQADPVEKTDAKEADSADAGQDAADGEGGDEDPADKPKPVAEDAPDAAPEASADDANA